MANTYELLKIVDGIEHRRYPDGTIRNQRGQLITLPAHLEDTIITSETSMLIRRQRKQRILEAIEDNVRKVTSANTPAEAIGAIVGKRAKIAMKDNTRTGNEAAKIVLQAMDAYQDKAEVRTNVLRNEYALDAETLALLQDMAEHRTNVLSPDVVDGETRTDVLHTESGDNSAENTGKL